MTGPLRAAVAVAAAGLVLLAVPASASAADGTSGQQLSVTPTAALDPTGQDVTVTGHGLPPVIAPRRPGDPARVVASATRATTELPWKTRHDIHDMITSAWEGWVRSHPGVGGA